MKKYFLSIVALAAMLFATSCQESLVEPQVGGTTTFTVQVPDQMGTKAFGDEASTNATINRLYVEVYSENGETLIYETAPFIDVVNGQATFTANLIQDQKYDIIFWAQKDEAYTTSDLRKIPMTNRAHNVDDGAAFFAFLDNFIPKGVAQPVELKRPFAQLNLGTTLASLNDTDLRNDLVLSQSYIKVENVAPIFNTVTGMGEGTVQAAEFTLADVPTIDLVVDGTPYEYVSMDYLPIAGDNQALVTVTAKITLTTGEEIDHIFTNVPVKENYRTNIVGNLISSTTDFNVTIEESWAGEDENYPDNDLENLYFAAANGGEVTLTEDMTLTEPLEIIANVTINLGGKTLTGSVTIADGVQATISNGKIINEDNSVSGITSNGDLTINNVEIESARHALRIESGKVIINGGTYKVVPVSKSTLYALNVGDGASSVANVVIKGGTFIGPKGTMADSGGALTVKVGSSVKIEGGDFSGGKSNTLSSNGTITISGGSFDQDPTTFVVDGYQVILKDGKYYVVEDEIDAIATTTDQLKDAIEASEKKEVYVVKGNYEFPDNNLFKAGQTIICEEGTVFTGNSKLNIKGSKVINATFSNPSGNAVDQTIDGVFENCTFIGSNALRWCYAGETVEFINCVFDGDVYGVHFDGGANEVIFKNCVLYGWNSFAGALTSVSFYDSELYGNGSYALIRSFADLRLENCYFDITNANHQDAYPEGVEAISPAEMVEINCEWVVSTQEQLVNAATNSSKVYLTDGDYNLKGIQKDGLTLIGIGENVKVANTTNYAGGGRLGAITKAINLENVTITNTIYTMEGGSNATFKNVYFEAGVRQAYGNNVKFESCSFGSNSEGYALHFETDANNNGNITIDKCQFNGGKVHLGGKRTYDFKECNFEAGTDFQVWSNITLENCSVDGTIVTSANIATLFPNLDLNKVIKIIP